MSQPSNALQPPMTPEQIQEQEAIQAWVDGRYRAKRDTHDPCAICGWADHMGIHLPVLAGERKGEPFGHEYRASGK